MKASSGLTQIANGLVLAGAGAFTLLGQEFVEGMTEAGLWVTYTEGAAGGTPTIRVGWFPSGAGFTPTTPGTHLGVVISAGLTLVAEEWVLANPGSPYSRVLHLQVPPGSSLMQISAAESGVIATPGTISAWWASRT